MNAVDAPVGGITVLLCDERTLRREVLARFLELSGIRVRIVAFDKAGTSEALTAPDEAIDLVIIDTGEKSCSHPAVMRKSSISSAVPCRAHRSWRCRIVKTDRRWLMPYSLVHARISHPASIRTF